MTHVYYDGFISQNEQNVIGLETKFTDSMKDGTVVYNDIIYFEGKISCLRNIITGENGAKFNKQMIGSILTFENGITTKIIGYINEIHIIISDVYDFVSQNYNIKYTPTAAIIIDVLGETNLVVNTKKQIKTQTYTIYY